MADEAKDESKLSKDEKRARRQAKLAAMTPEERAKFDRKRAKRAERKTARRAEKGTSADKSSE